MDPLDSDTAEHLLPNTGNTGVAPNTDVPYIVRRLLPKRVRWIWQVCVPFAVLIALWQLAVFLGNYPEYLFPSPIMVLKAGVESLANGQLLVHLGESAVRVALGSTAALVIGLPLGFGMGMNKSFSGYMTPVVTFFQAVPGLSWVPLAILWFGVGYRTVTFIVFLSVFFPILLSTILGIRMVSETLINAAMTLGASKRQLITEVYVPGALAQIVVGVRLGVAFGWRALVGAEMIGAGSGLGWLIFDTRAQLRTDLVIVGMITLGIVWLVLDSLLLRPLERRTVERWGITQG